MSTITCTAVVLGEDPAERTEAMVFGGFLAGYAGATRTSPDPPSPGGRPPWPASTATANRSS